jgi:hypothetical protein
MKTLSEDWGMAGMPGSFGVWFWEEHLLAVHDMGAMKALSAALVMAGMPESFGVLVFGFGGVLVMNTMGWGKYNGFEMDTCLISVA